MITLKETEELLAKAGHHNKFWGRAEVRELPHILMPGEEIICVVNGRYENGFAMLLATNRRILLIDKKALFMTMEDLRYDMISEVDYSSHVLDSSIMIKTINTSLKFKSMRQQKIRQLCHHIQHKVMELRQHPEMNYRSMQQPQQQYYYEQQAQQPQMPPADEPQLQYAPLESDPAEPELNPIPQALPNQNSSFVRQSGPYPAVSLTIRRRATKFYPFSG